MEYNFLRRLYLECTAHMDDRDEFSFNRLYERMDDASDSDAVFSSRLRAFNLPSEIWGELNDMYANGIGAYEEQGFINGFRLGMLLAYEVGEPEPWDKPEESEAGQA